jgi:uncharacterized OsmC-like protein
LEDILTTTYTLNDCDLAAVAALTETIAADPAQAATIWKADVTWKGAFRSEARVRQFDPTPSDEPAGLGGTDTAPNPVEQLLGAFGNCLAVGVAANASAREIKIDSLTISLEGDLDLSTFLGLADGHAGFGSVRARIDLQTEADSATVDDLIRHVVATSPVGHTLSNEVPVSVTRATA